MKFAICNEIFERWPWERVCEYTARLGYKGLEVAPFTLADDAASISPETRSDVRECAERHGIEILGLHWLLVKPPGLYITHPDAFIRRRTAQYFDTLVDLCADFGGKVMVIGSPKQRNLMTGVARDQAMSYAKEVFTPCLDHAAARGVTLALEPLSSIETNFIQTAAEAIDLIEQINHPNFRLNLDVKAMSSEKKPIPEIIRASRKHIAHVQVNDRNRRGPGQGEQRFAPVFASLKKHGYAGDVAVEPFDYVPDGPGAAARAIGYIRGILEAIE
jgi:sugar phosphate isomerase/epimerase